MDGCYIIQTLYVECVGVTPYKHCMSYFKDTIPHHNNLHDNKTLKNIIPLDFYNTFTMQDI